ncbi:MAG TPA: hypothetical protein VHS52_02150 [Acidimicrobiales bacterium]|nr:hypothetical protein [Acidimicrobiales bacterium]
MSDYRELIAAAEADYGKGQFKEAHIGYGRAMAAGDECDFHCRRMRGICSRRVGEQRLEKALEGPDDSVHYFNQAAKWLAKSEANLESALQYAPDDHRGEIRLEQARTEETIARFIEISGGDPQRRLSLARRYRDEALASAASHSC